MAQGPRELDDKVALVTGATRGIGLASALALQAAGARVVLTGRSDGAAAMARCGEGAMFVQADQASATAWSEVIDRTLAAFGRLDIAVLNAGVGAAAPLADTTLEDFDHINAVNLKGVYVGLQHCVGALRAHGQGGSIVLMSSVAARVGVADTSAYTAAKGGVRLLAKAAALELGPEGIRVNSLHPGAIRTDLLAGLEDDQLTPMIPLGRLGAPDDVAEAVVFLASDRSRFMTGAEVAVDGGWLAR